MKRMKLTNTDRSSNAAVRGVLTPHPRTQSNHLFLQAYVRTNWASVPFGIDA